MKTRSFSPTRPLSWTPVSRPGGVYCAPACGAGCTKANYDAAVKTADAMVKSLGSGWKPHVHENCGWHASAEAKRGDFNVYPVGPGTGPGFKDNGYYAILDGYYCGNGTTPMEAARDAARKMSGVVEALKTAFGSVEEAIK